MKSFGNISTALFLKLQRGKLGDAEEAVLSI
jgi:hypothetical protein